MPAHAFVCIDSPAPATPAECLTWRAEPWEPSPFALTVEQAHSIAVPTLALWALAWVVRVCARLLKNL